MEGALALAHPLANNLLCSGGPSWPLARQRWGAVRRINDCLIIRHAIDELGVRPLLLCA